MYQIERYDFTLIGQALKKARENRGWTREEISEMVDLTPRTIMYIENKGQHPSFQKFYELVTLLNVSIDQYLFPDSSDRKDSRHLQLDAMINELDSRDYIVLEANCKGIDRS